MNVAAVVLAGGQGSRIGGCKPLRTLGGATLLDRAWVQARTWSDVAAVAVRDKGQIEGIGLPAILDDPGIEGPLGGLAAALRFAIERGCQAVLTLPADMPFLPNDLRGRLEQALGSHLAALARSGGRLHPVCGLWRSEALELLPAYAGSGKRSLKGFGEALGHVAVDWPDEPFDPFFNVNTADDLAEAERRLRG